ncbi:MAG: PAS domain-containing protein [Alphaproteobacteria bacterium]
MVRIPDFSELSDRIVRKPHRALFEYWRSAFPETGWPGRQHFDPVDIPSLLGKLFLVDILRDAGKLRFWYQLLGVEITKRAERDMTEKWMEECFSDPDAFAMIERDYHQIIDTGIPHLGQFSILAPGKEYIIANRLVLPMASDGENFDMFVGMWGYNDDASQPPEYTIS